MEYGYVNGMIAVSRSLGDVDPDTGAKILGLSADAELMHHYLQDQDEFIIIACDGLWDVMDSKLAVAFARRSLQTHNDVQRTCEELVAEALRRDSSDNVTAMVVSDRSCTCRSECSSSCFRTILTHLTVCCSDRLFEATPADERANNSARAHVIAHATRVQCVAAQGHSLCTSSVSFYCCCSCLQLLFQVC